MLNKKLLTTLTLFSASIIFTSSCGQRKRNMISKHSPAYVCSHVFDNSKPVLLVCKEGGDWQFLCGGNHEEEETPRVIGIAHILERDKSLYQIMDLNDNWEAERLSSSDNWIRKQLDL